MLQSMGSQRVRHDRVTEQQKYMHTHTHTHIHINGGGEKALHLIEFQLINEERIMKFRMTIWQSLQ